MQKKNIDLTAARVKSSLTTGKGKRSYIIWIRNPNGIITAGCIFHVDNLLCRTNIEMLAVDTKYRGLGLADIMIKLLQYRMQFAPQNRLFVCAANPAVPFWTQTKYQFIPACPTLLEQTEINDEKTGDVTHLIWWFNDTTNTEQAFVDSLCKFSGKKKRKC